MNKLLSPAQAQAIYSALCELNNVGATLNVTIGSGIRVTSTLTGPIVIYAPGVKERYRTQALFADAYELS